MNKKIIGAVLAISTILSTSAVVTAEAPIKVKVGGELLETDVAPVAIDGRVMLPVRAVFEAIDAKVSYVAEEQKVVATKMDKTVTFVIGSKTMTVNGEAKEIDVPATVINNRTLVPVRACGEAFDLKVEWNDKTRTVKVKKPVSLLVEDDLYKYEYDENGNMTCKTSNGYWEKYEYDQNGNLTYHEDFVGYWYKYGYDNYGNVTDYNDSDGIWRKFENGNIIYEEDSDGNYKKYIVMEI